MTVLFFHLFLHYINNFKLSKLLGGGQTYRFAPPPPIFSFGGRLPRSPPGSTPLIWGPPQLSLPRGPHRSKSGPVVDIDTWPLNGCSDIEKKKRQAGVWRNIRTWEGRRRRINRNDFEKIWRKKKKKKTNKRDSQYCRNNFYRSIVWMTHCVKCGNHLQKHTAKII